MLEITAAMPGLLWVARYAQRRSNRYFLAELPLQMRSNGLDAESRGNKQIRRWHY